jgi:hypothetical protein
LTLKMSSMKFAFFIFFALFLYNVWIEKLRDYQVLRITKN